MKSHKSDVAITSLLLHQPGNSAGSPLNQMHRQQLELLLTDDLLLQGHCGKEDALAQCTSFNTLDNWGHKTPTQSNRKRNKKEKVKGSWPGPHTKLSGTSEWAATHRLLLRSPLAAVGAVRHLSVG